MRALHGVTGAGQPANIVHGIVPGSGRPARASGWTLLPSRVQRLAAGTALLFGGFVGGALIGEAQTAGRAHVAGACIALERSLEREALSRPAVDAVLRDLVGQRAPFRASFPVTAAQFRTQCAEISRMAFQLGLARRDSPMTTAAR